MSYFKDVNISQNVVADTNNSTAANLAGSASFVGKATSTLGVAGLQVSMVADQNCYVYVDQSPGLITEEGTVTTNGTTALAGSSTKFLRMAVGDEIFVAGETVRTIATIVSDTSLTVTSAFSTTASGKTYQRYPWDVSDRFDYITDQPFGVTVQAVNSYVRVRVTNKKAIATTQLRMQTALCPVVEAVPRALSSEGNFKVGVYEIEGIFGTKVRVSPRYEMKMAQSTRLVGAAFAGITLDTTFWTATPTSGGTATIATGGVQDGFCTLATNGTANGAIKLATNRYARYVSGYAMNFNAIISLPAVTGANVRRWGCYDANDGYYFSHNGTTLSVGYRKNGVDATLISSGSFNGILGTTYVVDTARHSFEIIYTSRVVGFVIDGEMLHKIDIGAASLVSAFTLPATFECINSGGNTNNNTYTLQSAGIHRIGQLVTQPTYKYQSGTTAATVCKYGAGNLLGISVSGVANTSVITLYDGITTGGAVIWASGAMGNNTVPFTVPFYGLPFAVGLTLAITAANSTVTVVYE